uniref:Uncharacterized protein n=1 Tax=Glossina brevipalpis TaxID=37001 RepID=A0A1A9W7X3_9MUSC
MILSLLSLPPPPPAPPPPSLPPPPPPPPPPSPSPLALCTDCPLQFRDNFKYLRFALIFSLPFLANIMSSCFGKMLVFERTLDYCFDCDSAGNVLKGNVVDYVKTKKIGMKKKGACVALFVRCSVLVSLGCKSHSSGFEDKVFSCRCGYHRKAIYEKIEQINSSRQIYLSGQINPSGQIKPFPGKISAAFVINFCRYRNKIALWRI